jgi:sRNA-binding protein
MAPPTKRRGRVLGRTRPLSDSDHVYEIDQRYVAVDPTGHTIGSYATVTEADLRERWPKAFNDARLPLKIGIHVDLKIGGDVEVMRSWTRHPRYLRNLIAGGARYDLDGKAAGCVSLDEQRYAWDVLHDLKSQLMIKGQCRGQGEWTRLSSDEVQELRRRMPKRPEAARAAR